LGKHEVEQKYNEIKFVIYKLYNSYLMFQSFLCSCHFVLHFYFRFSLYLINWEN